MRVMDRLDALRTFVAVADRQSFAEAARALRISPTAASRAVSELERDLGVVLLRRSTRSVGLTAEGGDYLARCRRILEELDEADRAMRGEDSEPHGEMVVTAPVIFGRMHVVPIALGLMRRHPRFRLRLTLTDRVIRLVEEGVDLALRIADLPDSALHSVRLGEVRRVLVASPAYLDERGEPSEVTQLRDHALLAFDSFAPNGEWRFTASGRPAIRVEPLLLTNSVEATVDAALAGMGIARVLSYQVAAHVRAGRLRHVLPAFDPPAVPVSLVFQASRRASPNLRAMIAAARAHHRDHPVE